MRKIIYVKENLFFQSTDNKNESCQLTDYLIVNQGNIDKNNTNFTATQNLNILNEYNFVFMNKIFNQTINIDSSFIIGGLTLSIEQFVTINQKNYDYKDALNLIQNQQNISLKQNWCNSDNVQNDNIIRYTVNSDILVNDVLYSTRNIKYYTFDIFDDFSFFVDKDVLQNKNIVDISTKSVIYDKNGNQILNFKNVNYMQQKIHIDSRKYFVKDNIDGVIFNNYIRLTNGCHTITIKKINTPQVYKFKINVVSPYRRVGDNIYYLNQNDRENAKFLSNYEIEQNIVNALDTTLTVS